MVEKVFQMGKGAIFCPVNIVTADFELVGRNTRDVFNVCLALVAKDLILSFIIFKLFCSEVGSFKENAIWAK